MTLPLGDLSFGKKRPKEGKSGQMSKKSRFEYHNFPNVKSYVKPHKTRKSVLNRTDLYGGH